MEIVYTVLCIACLCIGFFVGYSINKPQKEQEKKVFVTKKQDVKRTREQEALEEEVRKTMEKYGTILDNIDNYDGSPNNQRKVS